MPLENDKYKDGFIKWLKGNKLEHLLSCRNIESILVEALGSVGIRIKSLYEEHSHITVRLYISELIVKRDDYTSTNAVDFLNILLIMSAYEEYLSEINNPRDKTNHDKTEDSLIFAYFLARLNRDALDTMNIPSYSEAFKRIGAMLGQKASTIKNMRDEFDPYFENGRAGWYQRELRGSRKEVFNRLSNYSDEQLNTYILKLLAYYKSSQDRAKVNKKLIIRPDNMKEIKTKHRK